MTGSPLLLEEVIASIAAMEPSGLVAAETAGGNFGTFEGLPVKVQFDLDGRTGTLIEPISYTTAQGIVWPVPKDAWLDGASIPQVFWSVIGGPFEGKYREASIVHDHYCITQVRAWEDTHRMFYTAMLCRGVSGFKARIMYYAVYRFGLRWVAGAAGKAAVRAEMPDDASARSIFDDAQIILKDQPGLDGIEALANASHAART